MELHFKGNFKGAQWKCLKEWKEWGLAQSDGHAGNIETSSGNSGQHEGLELLGGLR